MKHTVYCLVALGLLSGIAGCAGKPAQAESKGDASADEASPLVVRAVPLELRTISETVSGLGRCEALPDRIASLTSAVEGQVQKILVKLGDQVAAGQPLVQLDSRIAQANLAEKVATRDGLNATLALLKAPPRPEELKSQEALIEQARLGKERAQAVVERLRPLLEKQQIPQSQLYEAEIALAQAKSQQESAEAQLRALKLGPRTEAVAEAESHIATADAQVASAKLQLDLYTLKSPIAGELDSLNCQLGQTLSPGAAVGEIVDTDKLTVAVWLPARAASRVKVGQKATVIAESAGSSVQSSNSDDVIGGDVTFVGHVADPQTGNLPVQVVIENPDGHFGVGQVVSVEITVKEKSDVLAAPAAALFDVGDGSVLDIVRDGKSVRVQPELGIRDKSWVEIAGADIKDAPKAGEMAIVEGGYNLPDGTAVKIEEKAADEEKSDEPAKSNGETGQKADAAPKPTDKPGGAS